MKLRIILFNILVILSFTTNILAGVKAKSQSDTTTIFKKLSLQFKITSFLRLDSFQGSMISAKYHFSNKFAFRFGVFINNDFSDSRTFDHKLLSSDDILIIEESQEFRDNPYYSYSIRSQFLYYTNPKKNIKCYLGIGPYFRFSKKEKISNRGSEREYDSLYIDGYDRRVDSESGIGFSTSLGVEYFIIKNISLLLEYSHLLYKYSEGTITERTNSYSSGKYEESTSDTSETGWRLTSDYVKFGLSVYL